MSARVDLRTNRGILANRGRDVITLARAIQRASGGRVAFTAGRTRLGDLNEDKVRGLGIDPARAQIVLSEAVDHPLRLGDIPLELLIQLRDGGMAAEAALAEVYRRELAFVAEDVVPGIEARQLKVFLLGGAGSGVVSAVQDMVAAFCSAGYYGRAFPLFDPSKKGAPVFGYGLISRDPILSHAPFETPDIILLFDPKLFPLLRGRLSQFPNVDPERMVILVNTPMDPAAFRTAAGFADPYLLYTVDASAILAGKRIPPNYVMIGALLSVLGREAVDPVAFAGVVEASLADRFGPGEKVVANIAALNDAQKVVRGEAGRRFVQSALGQIEVQPVPGGQVVLCEEGNRAIARAVAMVLNLFPSVVAAYPCTPQTEIVNFLAQMIADGLLSAEMVTPESEHGAGGALMGAARDKTLCVTALSGPGTGLMCEILHTISGLRMGNVLVSNVLRSLNSPLDVESDHADLYKILLDAGFITFMSRDVQQAADFHLMAYLVGMYAEYRQRTNGQLEMIPDRAVMLPTVVASEGFEVSHAPERYLALTPEQVEKLYGDEFFDYIRTFVQPGRIVGTNEAVMGALMLDNARADTDKQRDLAMKLAYEVMKKVFEIFFRYTGRKYDFIHKYNVEESEVVFVVGGAANGTFEEVAREFKNRGINVGVIHPNVLRPFPKEEWSKVLPGKKVFVFDRDDPFGSSAGRLAQELAWVTNEYGLASTGTKLYSAVYGLGGRTPTPSLVRDEILKALRHAKGEIEISPEKRYVGVNI